MKNGLFLLATITLSSALYAQPLLARQTIEEVFSQYNPQLMDRASKEEHLHSLMEQLFLSVEKQQPQDTLENRYVLIALARNFENSLAIQATEKQYRQALWYAQLTDPAVREPARTNAYRAFLKTYAQMWAVSVQVKEDLLNQYQQSYRAVRQDKHLPQAEQKAQRTRLENKIHALQTDIKHLRTEPGLQIANLAASALNDTEENTKAQFASLQAMGADNLQIKTKHKKPVAE